MKKTILIIQLFVSLCLLACHTNIITDYEGGGDHGDDGPIHSAILVADTSQLDQTVAADSLLCEVNFTTTAGWESYIPLEMQSWITLMPSSAEEAGEYTVHILLSENTTGSNRYAQIDFYCNGESLPINITQEAIKQDGSLPDPYIPDAFEAKVENIRISEITDGLENDDHWQEIRIDYDGERIQYADKTNIIKREEDVYDDRIVEAIHIHLIPEEFRLYYEHDFLDENTNLTQKLYSECTLNEQQHIKEMRTTLHHFLNESMDEPMEKPETTFFIYQNFRLQQKKEDYEQYRYTWLNFNNIDISRKSVTDEEYLPLQTLNYTSIENNKANLDLNQLFVGNDMALFGFLGKRSCHLLSSLSDSKGSRSELNYTFNERGYVDTITETRFIDGVEQPTRYLYRIRYRGGM